MNDLVVIFHLNLHAPIFLNIGVLMNFGTVSNYDLFLYVDMEYNIFYKT
jgi:hypothetical protein